MANRFNKIPNRDVFSEHMQAQDRLIASLKEKVGSLEEEVAGMKILLEIKAAEGGEDAKLLVENVARIYERFAEKEGVKILENDHG